MSYAELGNAMALVVSAALAAACLVKFRARTVFREQIADYELIPYSWTRAVALLLPVAELMIAIALIVPASRRSGALGATVLIGGFLAALASALWRHKRISCACFGEVGELGEVGSHSFVRTGGLFVAALIAASAGRAPWRATEIALAILIAMMLATVAELVRLLTDLRTRAAVLRAELFPTESIEAR